MSSHEYLSRLGLDSNPFPVVPDASNYYLPEHLNTILLEIIHVIDTRKGFAVVIGDIGLGKTTMTRVLMGRLHDLGMSTSLVFNTINQGEMLLAEINKDFGIKVSGEGLAAQMNALNMHLLACYEKGENCAIVIDDAQHLTVDSLELIRQISNLETDHEKIVQILLVGQPELNEKLQQHGLRQLKSRIVYQATVRLYSQEETQHYVNFKLNAAGNKGLIQIPASSIRVLQRISGGSPRLINAMMDRYLYGLVACRCKKLNGKQFRAIALESGLFAVPNKYALSSWLGWGAGSVLVAIAASLLFFGNTQKNNSFSVAELIPAFTGRANTAELFKADTKLNSEGDEPIKVPAEEAVVSMKHQLSSKSDIEVDGSSEEALSIKDPLLSQFLNDYDYAAHQKLFITAISQGMPDSEVKKINKLGELKLIILPNVSEKLRQQFSIYTMAPTELSSMKYLFLWNPSLVLEGFYFGYQSDSVKQLQQRLSALNFYTDVVDGVVGIKTMSAVARFQAAHKLMPTGQPDNAVLFLLDQENQQVHAENLTMNITGQLKVLNIGVVSYG